MHKPPHPHILKKVSGENPNYIWAFSSEILISSHREYLGGDKLYSLIHKQWGLLNLQQLLIEHGRWNKYWLKTNYGPDIMVDNIAVIKYLKGKCWHVRSSLISFPYRLTYTHTRMHTHILREILFSFYRKLNQGDIKVTCTEVLSY